MKIEHLLEMPTKAIPQAAANLKQKRLDRAQPKPATVGQTVIPNVNNPAVSMAKTNPQPTTLGAPSSVQVKQAPTGPAADSLAGWKNGPTASAQATQDTGSNYGQGTATPDASGRVEPTTEPDELANITKNAGLPAKQEPEELQATPAEEPGNNVAAPKDTRSAWQKTKDFAANAAQGTSNIIQRAAANGKENIPAITDYAGDLAQGVAPGLARTANAAGDVVQGAGQGIQKGLKGAAHVVGGLGDVGSEITGGFSKMIGAAKGGYNHGRDKYYAQGTLTDKAKDAAGWKDAARQNFADPRQGGMTPAQQSGTSGGGASASAPSAYNGGGDEMSQLKARLDKIEQRLGGAA